MDERSETGQAVSTSDVSPAPSRKRATLLQAAGGYALTGITIVQGLVLIPLYLHYIGAHTYGLWLASGGILGMLGLMNFGIGSMLIQRIASSYGKKEFAQAGAYFINGMVVYLGVCLLLGIVGWVVSLWLPEILTAIRDGADLLRQCFQLAVAAMVLAVFNECLRSFSQALLRPVIPVLGMVIGRLIGIAVTVWMLFDDFGLWAIPTGGLAAEGLIFIVNLFHVVSLLRWLDINYILDRNIIKEYVRTAPTLLGAKVGQGVAQESEPLLIAIFLTPEITTAYMIVRRAADIVFNLLSQIVGSVLGSFGHLAGSESMKKVSMVAYALIALIALLGVIGFSIYIVMNESFIRLWVGDEYFLSKTVVILLGAAFFLRIVRSMIWQLLNGMGDFIYTSLCILFEGVVRIALLVFFMPFVGVVAVPLALLIASLASLYILARRMNREICFVYNMRMVSLYLMSLLASFVVSVLLGAVLAPVSWLCFIGVLLIVSIVFLLFTMLVNWKLCKQIKLAFASR